MSTTTAGVPADPASVPERGPRPATATVAAVLHLLAVLLALALVVVAWIGYLSQDRLIDRAVELVPAADPDVVASERGNALLTAIMLSVLFGGIALWFGATLWPLWRGSNMARVVTAVGAGMLSGITVLAFCGGGLFGLLLLPLIASGPAQDPFPGPSFYQEDPFHTKLFELQDSGAGMWPGLALSMGGLLLTLLAGAMLVLLLLPPSNRWFSPRPPAPTRTTWPVYYPVYYTTPGAVPGVPPTPGGQPTFEPPPTTSAEPPDS